MVKKTVKFQDRKIVYDEHFFDCIKDEINRLSVKFKNAVEYAKKETHIEFVNYLNDMIDYDLSNGIDLASNDNSTKWFNFNDLQSDLIYYYDLISIGGRIMLNSFDSSQYAKINGGTTAAVETAKITKYIFNELQKIRNEIFTNKRNAIVEPYGVNCVLVSMIEHELKLHSSRKYIIGVLNNFKRDLDRGTVSFLCPEDEEYFNDLYNGMIEEIYVPNGGNDIWMTGERFLKFLHDYPAYSLMSGIEDQLFKRTLTLNQLIQNNYMTLDWNRGFLQLMKRTFGTSNLNLRNNLAHCGYTEYNYHSPFTSFYLNEIFIMIISDFYLD